MFNTNSAILRPGLIGTVFLTFLAMACSHQDEDEGQAASTLFAYRDWQTRWSSPENINGIPGSGGKENNGAKGRPYVSIDPGDAFTMLNAQGTGIIDRMWVTINDRSPEMLRSLVLEMFWDGETKPAVSVPFGDFFGVGLGKTATFQNALFANAEGRSFNCFIPMPFKKSALVRITNQSDRKLGLMFFDVDYQLIPEWEDEYLYFHAYWSRDTATTLARDFELLPRVSGKGRFLGVNVGINTPPHYEDTWWGEGEVKIYLNEDGEWPTLAGTGTEDYIGTAWGQGQFINTYTGCTIADPSMFMWAFYRYHIPDPVFFSSACRVTIQQIGGGGIQKVAELQKNNVPLIPVTIDSGGLTHLYTPDRVVQVDDPALPQGWTNFYRSDDLSATSYFYLDRPANGLPSLQDKALRTYKLKSE